MSPAPNPAIHESCRFTDKLLTSGYHRPMWSYVHDGFTVHQLPALQDNYIYLLEADDLLICIDPAEAAPVEDACRCIGRSLTHIFNTHHHEDHTNGNHRLKARYGCQIIASSVDGKRIPDVDIYLDTEQTWALDGLNIRTLFLPGHTLGHLGFLIADTLFCGDTLFGAGCGRLFEGTVAQMWQSLGKIARLPAHTRCYCAHEYTLANLKFCLEQVESSEVIQSRLERDKKRRKQGQVTVPLILSEELLTNPFLLPLDHEFNTRYAQRHHIALDPCTVFSHIRAAKDRW